MHRSVPRHAAHVLATAAPMTFLEASHIAVLTVSEGISQTEGAAITPAAIIAAAAIFVVVVAVAVLIIKTQRNRRD